MLVGLLRPQVVLIGALGLDKLKLRLSLHLSELLHVHDLCHLLLLPSSFIFNSLGSNLMVVHVALEVLLGEA